MDSPTRPDREHRPPTDQPTLDDRRRPGRVRNVNPHLIQLLRDPCEPDTSGPAQETAPSDQPDDDLAPARGIVLGITLSIALWAILILLVRWAVG